MRERKLPIYGVTDEPALYFSDFTCLCAFFRHRQAPENHLDEVSKLLETQSFTVLNSFSLLPRLNDAAGQMNPTQKIKDLKKL